VRPSQNNAALDYFIRNNFFAFIVKRDEYGDGLCARIGHRDFGRFGKTFRRLLQVLRESLLKAILGKAKIPRLNLGIFE